MLHPTRNTFYLLDLIFFSSAETVAEGFIQLLNDEDKVGEAMTISPRDGIGYHNFPAKL